MIRLTITPQLQHLTQSISISISTSISIQDYTSAAGIKQVVDIF